MNEELPEFKDFTDEQKKVIKKIIFRARLSMAWAAAKFGIGLFVANTTAIIISNFYLGSTTESSQNTFKFIAIGINTIFMARYFSRQLREIGGTLVIKVKEVIKGTQQ